MTLRRQNGGLSQKGNILIEVIHLTRDFPDGAGQTIRALSVDEFTLREGEAVALIGPSGSGKTTFLHCLSGILSPTEGQILINKMDFTLMSEKERNRWRSSAVGYIFQRSLLLPYLTVRENILLSAGFAGISADGHDVDNLLKKVGLEGYGPRKPDKLSGGEQQRVSFLRAMIRRPKLILADEPTASLDRENGELLLSLLLDYQEKSGCMLLCATHDPMVQDRFPRKFSLKKGRTPCTRN